MVQQCRHDYMATGQDQPRRGGIQSGPNGTAAAFFPASSFFDVFVQVDMPACTAFTKAFPGGALYNLMPLVVKNNQVTSFPPQVVYLHDATSIVPILFLNDNPGFWNKDDILGYFLFVGHGVGTNQNDFNNFMEQQPNATCPIGPPPSSSAIVKPKSITASSSSKGTKASGRGNSSSAGTGGGGGNRCE